MFCIYENGFEKTSAKHVWPFGLILKMLKNSYLIDPFLFTKTCYYDFIVTLISVFEQNWFFVTQK